jgi:hypothetical protein
MNTTPSAASFRRAWRAAIAACCAGLLVAQAPAPPPVDPALPDQLKELKSMVGDSKMQLDFQAISLMQKLVGEVEGKHPKDQERMAKAFGDVFRAGKLRTGDKEILYRETADALAKMKADGAKELAKAVTDARFKESLPLQAHMILALGRTQDEKQVEWLLETTIRSPRDELKAAAGEALGNFTSLEIKQRREVVKGIIREWGSLHQKATQAESNDPSGPVNLEPQTARATLRAVESKWVATLDNLTGVSQSGFQEWQRWLNKNPGWTPPGAKKS